MWDVILTALLLPRSMIPKITMVMAPYSYGTVMVAPLFSSPEQYLESHKILPIQNDSAQLFPEKQ